MTTHATTSLDSHHPRHHTLYNNRTYARTKTTTTTTTTMRSAALNRPLQTYLKATPQINVCENLLYDVAIAGDVGSATSSSYINSSEHYDNTYSNTYDNPIQYFERVRLMRAPGRDRSMVSIIFLVSFEIGGFGEEKLH